jgi:hypothetical protein
VAKARLQRSGLRYTSGGNAGTFGRQSTQVLVPGGSAGDLDRGRKVAAALGVPPAAVRRDPDPAAATAGYVVVLLGADFAARTDEALPSLASASGP